MTVSVRVLIASKTAEDTLVTQYTAINVKTIIDKFTATNTSSSDATLSVHLVNNNGTPTDANLIVDSRSIAPNETYTCPELTGQVLEPGMFISTIASSTPSITIRASGREIT